MFTCSYAEYWLLVEGVRLWTPVIGIGLERHAETLISLQWYVLVVTLRFTVYTLLGKARSNLGKNLLHPQKYALPYTYVYDKRSFILWPLWKNVNVDFHTLGWENLMAITLHLHKHFWVSGKLNFWLAFSNFDRKLC